MFTKATTTTAFIAALVAARPVFAIPSGDDEEKSDKAAQSDDGGIASPSTCGGQKLVAPDAGAGDLAGMVAALDGDTLLMGAPWDDNAAGADAGKVVAWEYFNGAWQQIPSPVPNNPQAGAFFGRSVGLAGDIAVVGAPLQNNYKGAAYFFKRLPGDGAVGWTQTLMHTPLDIVPDDLFGYGAAINETGDIAVFGAPHKDITDAQGTDDDAGQAYIYARNPDGTWSLEASLYDADPVSRDAVSYFGLSAAVSGEVAVISARSDNAFGLFDCGSVRVYRRNAQHQWNLEAILFAPQPQANAYFGEAVAIDGDQIAVGAILEGNVLINDGAVHTYRYQNGTWNYDGEILAPGGVAGEAFGGSVAISGDRIVASSDEFLQLGGNFLKRAFTFRRVSPNNWVLENTLIDPDDNANGFFGTAVAMDGPRFVVTDYIDDPNGGAILDAGAAYMYTVTSDDCANAAAITTGSYAGCTEGLDVEMANMCGPNAPSGPDAWFTYTATCEGTVTIDTDGSNFDTVLSVHNACIENGGITIACDDDGGIGTASHLMLYPDTGYTYHIRLGGYNGASGQFVLNLSTACPAPEPCPADIAPQPGGDDVVDVDDLLMVINAWGFSIGPADIAPPPSGNGAVNVDDLLMVINAWGACP